MAEPIRIRRASDLGWIAELPATEGVTAEVQDRLDPLVATMHQIGLTEGRDVILWSDLDPPGGWVCAWPDPDSVYGICGMPVESEPCPQHGHPIEEQT